jgi:hypothetical protein
MIIGGVSAMVLVLFSLDLSKDSCRLADTRKTSQNLRLSCRNQRDRRRRRLRNRCQRLHPLRRKGRRRIGRVLCARSHLGFRRRIRGRVLRCIRGMIMRRQLLRRRIMGPCLRVPCHRGRPARLRRLRIVLARFLPAIILGIDRRRVGPVAGERITGRPVMASLLLVLGARDSGTLRAATRRIETQAAWGEL